MSAQQRVVGREALRRAGELLAEAAAERSRSRRYALCRLSALHCAWAVCAARVDQRGSAGVSDPWTLLAGVRPALAEWSLVFAAVEARWSEIRRGARPGDRELDDLLREADAFRRVVGAVLAPAPAALR